MQTKIFSFSIFLILAISLVATANADSQVLLQNNLNGNKFFKTMEKNIQDDSLKLKSINTYSVALTENIGLSVNDPPNNNDQNAINNKSPISRTLSLSESLLIAF